MALAPSGPFTPGTAGFGKPIGGFDGSSKPTDPFGSGAFSVPQANPYTTGAGLQPGQDLTQMEGMDFSKPGPAQQQWIDQGYLYNQPTFGQTNTEWIVSNFSNPANRPDVTNNQQDWFTQFSSSMPNIAMDPGLAPYFENAKNRAAESINKSAAATGSYGASSANDQISRAFTDLEGQRALKEADYNLARLGEQRGWEGLGGQLAGGADAASAAISQDEQNWANLLSSMGLESSRDALARLNASFDAANVAENAKTVRGQNAIGNTGAAGDRIVDIFMQLIPPALRADFEAFLTASSGGVSEGNAAADNEAENAETAVDAGKLIYSVASQ